MTIKLKRPSDAERAFDEEQAALDAEHVSVGQSEGGFLRKTEFRRLASCLGLSMSELAPVLGKSKHTLASWSTTWHTIAPSREILDQMSALVLSQAQASLAIGKSVEAATPLSEMEFRAAILAEYNLRLIEEGESAKVRLPGRVGYLGVARVTLPKDLRFALAAQDVAKAAWTEYRRSLQETGPSPMLERDDRKRLVDWLVGGLNFPRQRLADMTGRALPTVNSWMGKWPVSPPESIVLDLLRLHLTWAVEYRLQADRPIMERPVPSVPGEWIFRKSEDLTDTLGIRISLE